MIPEEIEAVALLGWRVYPCSRSSKAARFKGATEAATYDLDTIARWCRDFQESNWRVVMEGSNIWAIDIDASGPDHAADGIAAFTDLAAKHGGLPHCPTTRSGGGGFAVFFKHNGEPIIGKSGCPAPGIDPRRGRQSVTIPPSRHIRTKLPYVWLRKPWEVSCTAAPRWLVEAVKPPPEHPPAPAPDLSDGDKARNYATAALRNAIGRVATAPSGQANDTLNRETYALARFIHMGSLTASEVRSCLLAGARARAIPIREAIATIESGLKARASA